MQIHGQYSSCLKSIVSDDTLAPVNVPATTSTVVAKGVTDPTNPGVIFNRYSRCIISIAPQAGGSAGACYFSFGNTCDLSNWDLYLPSGSAPFDISPYIGPISAYAVAAVAVSIVRFIDYSDSSVQGGGALNASQTPSGTGGTTIT